jgi:hypothetical protein
MSNEADNLQNNLEKHSKILNEQENNLLLTGTSSNRVKINYILR